VTSALSAVMASVSHINWRGSSTSLQRSTSCRRYSYPDGRSLSLHCKTPGGPRLGWRFLGILIVSVALASSRCTTNNQELQVVFVTFRTPSFTSVATITRIPTTSFTRSPSGREKVRMYGILDDVGKGIQDAGKGIIKGAADAAAEAVSGMTEEERDALLRKMQSGRTDFNDFLKMTLMLQKEGGVSGMMNTVTKMPGLSEGLGLDNQDLSEAEKKLALYSKVIDVMTEDEREQPGYFLLGAQARANVEKLAEKSGLAVELIDGFLDEFKSMSTFLTKMGAGKDMDTIMKEMERERTTSTATDAPRTTSAKGQPYVNPERRKKKLLNRRLKAKAASGSSAKIAARNRVRR